MELSIGLLAAGAVALVASLPRLHRRLQLSQAKHRSLAGHSRMSQRVARLVPAYAHDRRTLFRCDDAPDAVVLRRQAALARLSTTFSERFPATLALTSRVAPAISDLQFTGRYRVPFQFAPVIREDLPVGAFVRATHDVQIEDLDGNRFYDVTGSYGVNVFGHDFYKSCIAEGAERAQALGPLLGAYHPAIADVAQRLTTLSGLPEVSFHMSGTEAVMQAVRLARYHTRRKHLVRFCGSYHGWWEDVQPGIGNPLPPRETYTLRDCDPRSLAVLRTRDDIACVLVNPLQALHPNRNAPSDSALVDSSRSAGFDRLAYTTWLKQLRQVCSERNIVLIFDEVFVGFRLAPGGAQQYFGVAADLVTYGKTLGGGLPVGVVCGRAELMRRFDETRPANVCFARGTFNSHPYVISAMQVFLERLDTPAVCALYDGLDARWDGRARMLNERLRTAGLPLQVSNLSTIWTVSYTRPSCYNWLLQYYLRAEGIALSWVGTGRLIFSLNWTDADFQAFSERFIRAARAMEADGWWWADGSLTNRAIRRRIVRGMLEQSWHRLWGRRLRRAPAGAHVPSGRTTVPSPGTTGTSSTA